MRESDLEQYLDRQARARGGRAIKIVSPALDGWPDRALILPNLPTIWIETKRPEVGPAGVTPRQQYWLDWLAERGQFTAVIWTQEGVDTVLDAASRWEWPGGRA
jgi:hypothetical protein